MSTFLEDLKEFFQPIPTKLLAASDEDFKRYFTVPKTTTVMWESTTTYEKPYVHYFASRPGRRWR